MFTPEQIDRDIRGSPVMNFAYYFCMDLLDGLFLEFGVAGGNSIRRIATLNPSKKIYGFDSFHGLPERWGTLPKGHFACDVPNNLPSNVELVVGLFDATLPQFLSEHPGDVAFAHIDSDLYESAKCVLDNLKPRLKPGSILAFDEIWAHSNYQDYEAKAFAEFLNDTGFQYHCIGHFGPDKAGFKLLRST
jgi:methyltransferase family protein